MPSHYPKAIQTSSQTVRFAIFTPTIQYITVMSSWGDKSYPFIDYKLLSLTHAMWAVALGCSS